MRAGEGLIFTSLNVHGSQENTTSRGCLAFTARVMAPNTVYEGWSKDTYIAPAGNVNHPVSGLKGIQMSGRRHHPRTSMADATSRHT